MEKTAYVFHELDRDFREGRRLSDQAQAFVEIELPAFLKKIPPRARIADFGCGTGVISAALAQSLPEATIVGLDLDEQALVLAAKNGRDLPNLSFERFGFETGEPVLTGSFDVAFTRLVLLHLPDPAAALARMGNCLKPGGLLYVVDCDDDYVNFSPKEPWQAELISLMGQAQALRGGTRTLGSKLLKLVEQGGFWPEGSRVVYYSTQELGRERWKNIFVPALGNMAERDLRYLLERKLLDSGKLETLKESMGQFFGYSEAQAQLSTWHVWARKVD